MRDIYERLHLATEQNILHGIMSQDTSFIIDLHTDIQFFCRHHMHGEAYMRFRTLTENNFSNGQFSAFIQHRKGIMERTRHIKALQAKTTVIR